MVINKMVVKNTIQLLVAQREHFLAGCVSV